MLDIAVPREKQEGGTLIIPGHGRICNEADLLEYRDMLVIIRDRVERMIGMGMTLQEIRAAGPSQEYDGLYGATDPAAWTPERKSPGAS